MDKENGFLGRRKLTGKDRKRREGKLHHQEGTKISDETVMTETCGWQRKKGSKTFRKHLRSIKTPEEI